MSKRRREEEATNDRNCRSDFFGSFYSLFDSVKQFASQFAFGITSETIPQEETEPMENHHEMTMEHSQKEESADNWQKNEESPKPVKNYFGNSSSLNPIKEIRALKAEREENRFLLATLHSPSLEKENYNSLTSAYRSERKTSNSNQFSTYQEKETISPYKYDISGDSSTKVLTPRKLEPILEERHDELNSFDESQKKLRESSAAYRDKCNLLTQSLRLRRADETKRKTRKFLTPEQEAKVKQIYKEKDYQKIYVTINNIDIKYEDLQRILPGQWLNDELINCYMSIINDESKKKENNYPKVHCFNTFFNVMLLNNGKGYSYQRVSKWTKTFDIFALDYVIIPVHVGGNHWCLGVINIRDKKIEYYDSMGGTNPSCIKNLKQYVVDEHQAKKGSAIDITEWGTYTPADSVPQQNNAFDCGVFMCQFAESIASANDIQNVNQVDMPYYRKRMMLEILHNNRHFDNV